MSSDIIPMSTPMNDVPVGTSAPPEDEFSMAFEAMGHPPARDADVRATDAAPSPPREIEPVPRPRPVIRDHPSIEAAATSTGPYFMDRGHPPRRPSRDIHRRFTPLELIKFTGVLAGLLVVVFNPVIVAFTEEKIPEKYRRHSWLFRIVFVAAAFYAIIVKFSDFFSEN